MKKIYLSIMMVVTVITIVNGQNKNNSIVTNELIKEQLVEYISEAKKRGLLVEDLLKNKLDYILIETNLKDDKSRKLCGKTLSKLDLDKKFLLLSEVCSVDTYLLKSELFKQLSFCLGVKPVGQNTIISNVFTPKYTNAYLTDPELRKEEYDFMFSEVKKVL